jgi:hypothetical protein
MTLAVVPLAAITGLAIFGVVVTAPPALGLLYAKDYEHAITDEGEALTVELQRERRMSLSNKPAELGEQRKKTDEQFIRWRNRLAETDAKGFLTEPHMQLVNNFQAAVNGVSALRDDFDSGRTDQAGLIARYNAAIDLAYLMFEPLTELPDAELGKASAGLFGISRAREMLAREDSVVTGSLVDGKLSVQELSQIMLAIGARRQLHNEAGARLVSPFKQQFEGIFTSDPYKSLTAMEESIAKDSRPGFAAPIDPAAWRLTLDPLMYELDETEGAAARAVVAVADGVAIAAFTRLIVAVLLGLTGAAISLTLALRTGRSVVKRLERLRVSALEVAIDRLPRAIAVLRQPGTPSASDLALTEIPLVAVGQDEIGQVGHAFGAVQRTAIRAAIDEASLRRGLNDVFLNIARRSQALLHRQLTLLDRMERRTTQPQELEDLFRLDHMATRMRRHAEALVILAGSTPGRGWRHPVPVIDVVRGATSEIEDYTRVTLDRLPEVRIVGRAVGDLIHLLAELLENAASFAPPHTRVRISAEIVGQGLALQVEDRGLGMNDTELLEANIRLNEPPAFDPAHSARLGLLVVSKLASRHGISVQLRHSPYGGVTAVVLVPSELVINDGGQQTEQLRLGSRPTSAPAVAAIASAKDEVTVELSEPATDGLPKRRRRGATADAEATDTADDQAQTTINLTAGTQQQAPRPRSAEQVRAMMSAFQTGTARGRATAAESDPTAAVDDEAQHARKDRDAPAAGQHHLRNDSPNDSTTLEGRA